MSTVIALDGPSGSGKSTVARAVGAVLGLPVLETGAMYRALTWAALRDGIAVDDEAALSALADRVRIEVDEGVRVDGVEVTAALRQPEVSAAVSAVSAVAGVRRALVARQREWIAGHGGGVVEGRDIGTVVAPDAPLKVFLVAGEDERARRRHRQDHPEDPGDGAAPSEWEATREEIRRRDTFDANRPLAPLVAAGDAVVLDTTCRSIDDVVAEVVARFRAVVEQ